MYAFFAHNVRFRPRLSRPPFPQHKKSPPAPWSGAGGDQVGSRGSPATEGVTYRLLQGHPADEGEVHTVWQLGVRGQDAQGTLAVTWTRLREA